MSYLFWKFLLQKKQLSYMASYSLEPIVKMQIYRSKYKQHVI
jgi:hypothetical protein